MLKKVFILRWVHVDGVDVLLGFLSDLQVTMAVGKVAMSPHFHFN